MENIAVYCINLEKSTKRLERMQRRFAVAGLTNINIIKAKTPGDIKYYIEDIDAKYIEKYYINTDEFLKDVACYASHMASLKAFVQSEYESCLICEDDILFHNDFMDIFNDITKISEGKNLISLSYMLTGDIDQNYIHRDCKRDFVPGETWDVKSQKKVYNKMKIPYETKKLKMITGDNIYHGLWNIDSNYVWGAQCYYIRSKKYAQSILSNFDQPFQFILRRKVTIKITSELIIKLSGGLLASIPLVIEDGIDSDRQPLDLPAHQLHFCRWNWKNYNKCDPEKESPLARMLPKDSWPSYPYKL